MTLFAIGNRTMGVIVETIPPASIGLFEAELIRSPGVYLCPPEGTSGIGAVEERIGFPNHAAHAKDDEQGDNRNGLFALEIPADDREDGCGQQEQSRYLDRRVAQPGDERTRQEILDGRNQPEQSSTEGENPTRIRRLCQGDATECC